MKQLFVIFFSFAFYIGFSSNIQPIGARSAALSHATVASSGVLSSFQNQASLAYLQQFSAGFSVENRFLIPELNIAAFAMSMPTQLGVISANVQRFGNTLYSESKYGLSYSKLFNDKIAMGLQLSYLETRLADNYGFSGRLLGEFGFRAQMTDDLFIGGHIFNPTRTNVSRGLTEKIPTRFRLGLQYSFSEQLTVFSEIEKSMTEKLAIKAALEYEFLQKFYFRLGLSNRPLQNSFGFGINLGSLRFDLAAQYNALLGFSPQVGLVYQP